MKSPLPKNEKERLGALREHEILDTPSEIEFDDITLLASQICRVPIAVISLIDEDRQWFKSKVGLTADEVPREHGFCSLAILEPGKTMIVEDALADDRFANNPLVTSEPQIRFYAGAPLVTHGRFALGTISVMDREPRDLTPDQIKGLEALARQISLRLELRQTSRQLQRANEELKEMSLRDELTGLYNRRGFLLHAEQQLKLFRSRESDRSLWMMLADMDGLKVINDTFGHAEGSLAIKAVADILRKTFRDADILARPGGDEFTALLLNTLDEVAERLPERLRLNFADHNAESGKPYKVEISIGLIKVGFEEGTSVRDLIQQADIEMYKDKARRRAGRK